MNQSFLNIRLREFTIPAKVLVTCVLLTLGTGYIFALTNVALQVGFKSEDVTLHYYGNEATRRALEEMKAMAEADTDPGVVEEDAMSFDELDESDPVVAETIVPVPSFDALVAEGHFHLFGYTSIFFLCGLILLFAEIKPGLKSVLIAAPFVASVLDIWSMLLTRFVGAGFAWMLMISGAVMASSFLLVFVIGIYQTWFMKPNKA